MFADTNDYNVPKILDNIHQRLTEYLHHFSIQDPLLVGIHTGGVWVAEELNKKNPDPWPMGKLNISFYRDDFTRIGLHPNVKASEINASVEDRNIVLVDDVIMSGRTIRAALNEIFDYGRPGRVILVTLVDLASNELPIRPDITGITINLKENQRVKLNDKGELALTEI